MTVDDALAAFDVLRIEAEMLLAAILGRDRTWIFAHPKTALSHEEEKQWNAWKVRRMLGEPVAYILGEWEFFGRKFLCDRRALLPRASTEGLVERALETLRSGHGGTRMIERGIIAFAQVFRPIDTVRTVVDVGTGSGCIAVTVALERPDLNVIATDKSGEALSLARENAERFALLHRIKFLEGDLLEPMQNFREPFFIISNLPYIPDARTLAIEVENFEPRMALRGGEKGTECIVRLMHSAKNHPFCHGVALECEESQTENVTTA